ncbi:MAG: cation:dicarboxylase symporter family transporter, partial [Armatimonadota bacterium]
AVLFFAQAFGVDLSFGQQVIVAFTAMLAAVGAAGIPSAGLVTMALVLTAVGLPLTGIGLLLAIDRPLDMLRTAVNVYGDASACRVVQTWNPSIRPEEDDEAEEKL